MNIAIICNSKYFISVVNHYPFRYYHFDHFERHRLLNIPIISNVIDKGKIQSTLNNSGVPI